MQARNIPEGRNWSERTGVGHIVDELRAMSLDREDGEFIGTEEHLTRHFCVSGPTLRKAVRQLEHEEVVVVKRGVRGGFFARRPQIGTVARLAGIYLSAKSGSLENVPSLFVALTPLMIDSVLASPRLSELEPFAVPEPEILPREAFLNRIMSFGYLMWELTDNHPLQICLAVLGQAGLSVVALRSKPDEKGQRIAQDQWAKVAQALLAGDRSAAIEHYILFSNLIVESIKYNQELQRREREENAAKN